MNSSTQKFEIAGSAGVIEGLIDEPADVPADQWRGTAVIAHPHPLFGGTMDNKVVQTMARGFVQTGWRAVRFNFRGVGGSAGVHDNGAGELQDMLAVVAHAGGSGPLALAGFSFGAFVTSHALAALSASEPAKVVLVGTAASRFSVAPVAQAFHDRTLVLHGEQDDTVPLSDVMDWARPQSLPVTVVPGGGHFFHGQLPLLRSLVVRHLMA
ncbi:CocE/NonD family hydrolase [Rhodoferax sp. OV413]|uniref:alpha/beta hydrolase n=1 Tax=Rhodoferax sp. OV413 TaxID=1855285 RepID=UPI0025EEF72A|nr:CocE/NonD family hydrolase [Rhodoferax sp. OV413]